VRIAPAMLAICASLYLSVIVVPASPVAAAGGERCTDWTSRSEPPPTIRVYRVTEGFVETVDFKDYVIRVVSREWNVKQTALRNAGAQAAKQYAWYHVLRYRGGMYEGQCFDVRHSTADQLYAAKPLEQIPERVKTSVDKIWSWRLLREGKFIMTGYRRGKDVPCAEDAGWKLFALSGGECARKGWSTARILRVYYTADLVK
jgi:peptidoglycan hydrolase-like amidase